MTKKKVATDAKSELVFTQQKVPFTGGTVRMGVNNGELWFVGADVCKILDIENAPHAISKLDSDEKNTIVISDSIPGNPTKIIINESGLYNLIFSSRKPEAKQFKKWITSEVIPSIRRNGAYISDEATTEQVKFLLENQIVEKLIQTTKGERRVIGSLVKQLLDTHDARHFHRVSYPHIIAQLTERRKFDAKELMFGRMIEPIREWGNDRYKHKKLQLTDQFDIMALLKTMEEDQSTFLAKSRGQIVKHRNRLKAELEGDI